VEIELLESDLATEVMGRSFDVIAANLPYIPDGDPRTEPGVVRHEPHLALYAGVDGLDLIRRLVADAPALLHPGGMLVLENSDEQAEAVKGLLEAAGFVDVAFHRDLAGVDRVVAARLG
jgi:release factor glutamine methyltransferase